MKEINMTLHTKFKVLKIAKTQTRIFKDMKVGDIIDISIPLDIVSDREKGQRMRIYVSNYDDFIYISDLNRMINKGFEFEEIKPKKEECNHLIGLWDHFTWADNITLPQLKEKISSLQKLYDSLKKDGYEFEEKLTLKTFLESKENTELTRYTFCPLCGEKIDWEKIKESGE